MWCERTETRADQKGDADYAGPMLTLGFSGVVSYEFQSRNTSPTPAPTATYRAASSERVGRADDPKEDHD
jgi:hypothetical protein